ncbi:MAG: biotin transporter BioY [Spirochaetes bacterium]|nr:biotin transporter BioY [Spirochaetota bacterium]
MVASRIMETNASELTKAVLSCLFAALISIGAYIALPLPGTPVPIVLQNLFIIMAAAVLGPGWGFLSVVIYLIFGLVGMPVFSGGTGGIAKFLGPTGGYLVGYLPASFVIGLIADRGKRTFLSLIFAGFAGMTIVYCFGITWIKLSVGLPWGKALASGLIPFLPGDLAKILLAAFLVPRIRAGMDALNTSAND